MASSWDKTKDLLQNALAEVNKLSAAGGPVGGNNDARVTMQSQTAGAATGNSVSSSYSPGPTSRVMSAFEEHRRIYGYKPLTSAGKGKRSNRKAYSRAAKRPKLTSYTKDTICIMKREQTWLPTTEERIELAKLGLGLKKLTFDGDGDAQHIHDTITTAYPVLIACGGYTLMRLAENSRELVSIDGPDGGMTIPFLKDILRQAKLYVRPLQMDITVKEAKKLCTTSEMSMEPEESCRICKKFFPLSLLQQHVNSGCQETSGDHVDHVQEVDTCDDDTHVEQILSETSVNVARDSTFGAAFIVSTSGTTGPVSTVRTAVAVAGNSNIGTAVIMSDSSTSTSRSGRSTLERAFTTGTILGNSTYSDFVNLISDDEDDICWEEERQIQEAIDASMDNQSSETITRSDGATNPSLAETLNLHRDQYLHQDKSKVYRITVRRAHIWQDALKCFERNFDVRSYIRVTFLGEPAVDDGGPRREFFMLLMEALNSQEFLLSGEPTRRVLKHNTQAFDREVYYTIGKMIALSIIHGGPAPTFFADPVIDYLFGEKRLFKASYEDIPDLEIRQKVEKLLKCKDEAELRCMLDSPEYEFRHDCGVTQAGFSVKFEDQSKIISAFCRHFAIFAAVAEIEQMLQGLETLEFGNLLRRYPHLFRQIFKPDIQPITADFIQDFFEVKYSPVGSNKRQVEENIIMHWITYLHDIEYGKEVSPTTPTIRDVFIFLTGCDSVPPLGFGGTERQIEFDDEAVVPRVSTCSLVLFLPTTLPLDYQIFKEKMDFYILSSQGFGQL